MLRKYSNAIRDQACPSLKRLKCHSTMFLAIDCISSLGWESCLSFICYGHSDSPCDYIVAIVLYRACFLKHIKEACRGPCMPNKLFRHSIFDWLKLFDVSVAGKEVDILSRLWSRNTPYRLLSLATCPLPPGLGMQAETPTSPAIYG